jgi:hypothetical protein
VLRLLLIPVFSELRIFFLISYRHVSIFTVVLVAAHFHVLAEVCVELVVADSRTSYHRLPTDYRESSIRLLILLGEHNSRRVRLDETS